jgi:glycosyltransferase involved in cell wall biosynthesis
MANGKVGLHANPLDPESIADAAERLWRDTELTRRLGNAGNDLVRKLYTLEGFIDRFETMLFDDAKRRGRRECS